MSRKQQTKALQRATEDGGGGRCRALKAFLRLAWTAGSTATDVTGALETGETLTLSLFKAGAGRSQDAESHSASVFPGAPAAGRGGGGAKAGAGLR